MKRLCMLSILLGVSVTTPLKAQFGPSIIDIMGPSCFTFAVSPFWIECTTYAFCTEPDERAMSVSYRVASDCSARLGEVYAGQGGVDQIVATGDIWTVVGGIWIGGGVVIEACDFYDFEDPPWFEPCSN